MKNVALIIGAGIGGLTAGALLAKRGWKVILFEQSSRIGGCCCTFPKSGFTFETGPTLFPHIKGGGFDKINSELGLNPEKIFVDPFSQICIPDHRIGLYKEHYLISEEWGREFPECQEDIELLLRRLRIIENKGRQKIDRGAQDALTDRDTIEKITWRDFFFAFLTARLGLTRLSGNWALTKALKNSPAVSGFDLLTRFWGQTGFNDMSLFSGSLIWGIPFHGGFCLKGGSHTLCTYLSRCILAHGGEIRLNSQIKEILIKNGGAAGIKIQNGEKVKGRCYIANATPWGLYHSLIPEARRNQKILSLLEKASQPKSVFALFLGVKESCLPSEIGQNVLFLPGESQSKMSSPLFISISHPEDQGRSPEGYRAMTVFQEVFPQEWRTGEEGYSDHKKRKEEEILNLLKRLIPFIEEGIHISVSATPITYERLTGRYGGMVRGVPQTPKILHNKAFSEITPYKDLFITGDCITPGPGVEGIFCTTLRLVDWICRTYI